MLEANQNRYPNFIGDDGKLRLIRCFSCPDGGDTGKENWATSVASGECAWCGWVNKQEVANEARSSKD
jgi:hypothetical protein